MSRVMKGTAKVCGTGKTRYAQINTQGELSEYSSDGFNHDNDADARADLPDMIAFAEAQAAKHGITIEWEDRP